MQQFGVIHSRYWLWATEEGLTPAETVVGAYLLSCPHGNSLGCFRCPIEYAAADLGYSIDTVSIAYTKLKDRVFIAYCEHTKYILLCKFLHWNPIQNPKHGMGTAKVAISLPEKLSIIDKVLESIQKYGGPHFPIYSIDTLCHRVSEPYPIPYRYTGTGTDTNTGTGTDTKEDTCPKSSGEDGAPQEENTDQERKSELEAKTFAPEIVTLVEKFQATVTKNHGRTAPKITEKLINDGCDAIDKLTRIDGFTFEEVRSTLLYGIEDDFWKDNLKSLAQVRSKCKNGLTKFQNVFDRWKQNGNGKKPKTQAGTHPPKLEYDQSIYDNLDL